MNKIALNKGWGGFQLTTSALKELKKIKIEKGEMTKDQRICIFDSYSDKLLPSEHLIFRHDPDLIRVIEKLGSKASPDGSVSIEEIDGDKYFIREYDGWESVVEPKNIHWIEIK